MVDGLHCKAVNPINCLPCHSNESIIQAFLPKEVIARPATQGVCVLCRNALYNPAQLPTVFPVLLAVRLILSTIPTTLAAGQILHKNEYDAGPALFGHPKKQFRNNNCSGYIL